MEDMKEDIYVSTNEDMWNSGDNAKFVVMKDQIKKLPEPITPIIANALEQGLLREIGGADLIKAREEDRVE